MYNLTQDISSSPQPPLPKNTKQFLSISEYKHRKENLQRHQPVRGHWSYLEMARQKIKGKNTKFYSFLRNKTKEEGIFTHYPIV